MLDLVMLDTFCEEVGMKVNIDRTKMIIFSLQRKVNKPQNTFREKALEIVHSYR